MWRQLTSSLRSQADHVPLTVASTVFFSSAARPRSKVSGHRFPHRQPSSPSAALQKAVPRHRLHRTSLMEQLCNEPAQNIGTEDSAVESVQSFSTAAGATKSVASSVSPYIGASSLISPAQRTRADAAARRSTAAHTTASFAGKEFTATSTSVATASLDQQAQQRALRDAFTHARAHHNVQLRKDPTVYREEVRAFRQAHQGRYPTTQEVQPIVQVPLAPVAALKTLAHTDPRRSILHATTTEALLLHNAVVKNELVRSGSPQLVRCLRCFHVYEARPRTLWGKEVQQSGIEYANAQAQIAADRALKQKPWKRKHVYSVGRQLRAAAEDPKGCPQCGSPRAQWMMEYVHHHTHEKS